VNRRTNFSINKKAVKVMVNLIRILNMQIALLNVDVKEKGLPET